MRAISRPTRAAILAAAVLSVTGLHTRAAGDSGPDAITGTWQGPWYLGMTSGTATLVLEQAEGLRGSLQLTNNEAFGSGTRSLQDVVLSDGSLRFRVKGADGRVLSAELPVTPAGRALKGFAKYGGYSIRLELVGPNR